MLVSDAKNEHIELMCKHVLILVLVDVGLGPLKTAARMVVVDVLILVLVDVGLGQY